MISGMIFLFLRHLKMMHSYCLVLAYDLLPVPANFLKWRIRDADSCALYGNCQTAAQSCQAAMWLQAKQDIDDTFNEILKEIACIIDSKENWQSTGMALCSQTQYSVVLEGELLIITTFLNPKEKKSMKYSSLGKMKSTVSCTRAVVLQ